MPSGTLMTAETTHLNPRRSKSSVPVQLNLPVDLASKSAPGPKPWGDAVVWSAQLIVAEIARRQERERLRSTLEEALK